MASYATLRTARNGTGDADSFRGLFPGPARDLAAIPVGEFCTTDRKYTCRNQYLNGEIADSPPLSYAACLKDKCGSEFAAVRAATSKGPRDAMAVDDAVLDPLLRGRGGGPVLGPLPQSMSAAMPSDLRNQVEQFIYKPSLANSSPNYRLGICLPSLPMGAACNPLTNDGQIPGARMPRPGSGLFPDTFFPSGATVETTVAYAYRVSPSFDRDINYIYNAATNAYTMAPCMTRTLAAAGYPGENCTSGVECIFGPCVSGSCSLDVWVKSTDTDSRSPGIGLFFPAYIIGCIFSVALVISLYACVRVRFLYSGKLRALLNRDRTLQPADRRMLDGATPAELMVTADALPRYHQHEATVIVPVAADGTAQHEADDDHLVFFVPAQGVQQAVDETPPPSLTPLTVSRRGSVAASAASDRPSPPASIAAVIESRTRVRLEALPVTSYRAAGSGASASIPVMRQAPRQPARAAMFAERSRSNAANVIRML
ncbi:hypothetical protein H9P43_009785 [Blastocladiella emersonii ATCC 22665]|nr:hypothetical protein H9P43_009785 [Blastocladiella emersonii ATCC 22665]